MERGGFQRRHPRSSSDAIVVSDPTNFGADNSSNNTANDGGFAIREPRPPCAAREQDQYMPIANVIRIMRRILPSHAKISDDAKETMQECVSEYISFITGEANERCQREQRKTITAEDLLWAMGKLGFDNYIQPLTVYLNRYREVESERTSRGEAYKRHVDFVLAPPQPQPQPFGVPPYVPAFQMGYNPAGMFDAAAAMGGYYRDGGSGAGGSSSQAPMANFDPYAEYK